MSVVVVGSGLAAVGAVRALLAKGHRPTVLDIGDRLPTQLVGIQRSMSRRSPSEWTENEWHTLAVGDNSSTRMVPRKLVLGSDYFYSSEQANLLRWGSYDRGSPPWSSARGGFSVGWGAAVLPPAPSDVAEWPITHHDIVRNMREVLEGIPLSEPTDELGDYFGRLRPNGGSVLPLSRGQLVLHDRLRRSAVAEDEASARTVFVGQSRLLTQTATESESRCRFCGHCSSGCVYGSIYTAEHDFERWIRDGFIDYRPGVTVFSVNEQAGVVRVGIKRDDRVETIEAERLFLAAGAVNSARVLLNSEDDISTDVTLRRTGYVVQMFASPSAIDVSWPDINTQTSHFVVIRDEEISPYWAHAQIGQPNEAILRRLGVRATNVDGFRAASVKFVASRMISVALNVHSSLGPTYEMRIRRNKAGLPSVDTRQEWGTNSRNAIDAYSRSLAGVLRPAGFYTIPLARQSSGAALTYHFGASFPMRRDPRTFNDTDVLGRPFGWSRVHVVDTSVLPAIPATTVGLLTMANAHRIATATTTL